MVHKIHVYLAAILFLIAGCTTGGTKETIGTLGGAVAGGLLGSQIGGGAGKVVAVGAGTLLGAWIGKEIGKSLDEADRVAMERSTQTALNTQAINRPITWNNPETGHTGTSVVRREVSQSNQKCRMIENTVTVNGKTESSTSKACLQSNGQWKLVEA